MLRLLSTVQVTPDAEFANGGLGYIHYVAATDRFIVVVETTLSAGRTVNLTWGSEACSDRAVAYKEYDTNMQPTGGFGYFSCAHEDDYDIADVTTRLIGNDLYVVGQVLTFAWKGWRLERFDVTTWQRLAATEVHLDYPTENDGGPNISFINGQVDAAGGYAPNGPWVGSHHHLFTRDLAPLEKKILQPPEYPVNVPELSMLQPAEDIYLFAGGGTKGLTVLRLDKDWNFIEETHLMDKGVMPSGSVTESGRFYVGYLDPTGDWSNTALAVFDSAWNLLQDIALTSHSSADNISAASSWVETHGGRIYASWNEVIESQGAAGVASAKATPLQVYVDVFEILPVSTACSSFTNTPTSASAAASAGSQQVTVTGSPSGCTGGSWTASGNGSWLTVSPSSGTGSGSATVSWTANTSTSPRTGTATIAGQTFTVTQAAGGTTALTGDWVPCGPPGGTLGGPGEDVIQPSRTRVLIARSQDGLHFERPSSDAERFLMDQADIPDAVILPSGRVLVYVMAGCRDYTPYGGTKRMSDNIAVAVSDAKGAPGSWVFKDVTFDNAAHGLGRPFDPNIVLWKPGQNLLRMFVSQAAGGSIATHSYTSTDGFAFTYEGRRYDPGPPNGIIDPESFRFDDTHWYIFSGGPNGFATSSDDGSTFTRQGYFRDLVTNLAGYEGVPHDISVTTTPGTYRAFTSVFRPTTIMGGIDSLWSTASPWTTWQWEGPVLDMAGGLEACEVRFPTVVRLAADDWLMFYGTGVPNCVCGGEEPYHCAPPLSAPTCYAFTISPTSAGATASAGSQTVTVSGWPVGCTGGSWNASTGAAWLTLSAASGNGSGSVTVSWDANTGASQRIGTATIAGQTFTVSQAHPSPHVVRRHLLRPPFAKLTRVVRVTPDDTVQAGEFIRLGYVPALDRIVAAFATMRLVQPQGGCTNAAHLYKVYTTDMQPEGSSVVLNCGAGDSADVFVDNDLYDVSDTATGWHIIKYDAMSWVRLAELHFDFADPRMLGGDEMAVMVNGLLDVSGMYAPPGQDLGDTSTHHNFFTPDLQYVGQRVLSDTRNTNGSSMIFQDGTYNFITGSPGPNLVLMRYDINWNYLGAKLIREHGMWSEGVAFDGQRYYVAYMDTRLVAGPPTPMCTNIHLAAFDRDWGFLGELAVTNYTVADDVEAWRPWIAIHDNRMYVAYDVVPHDPVQHKEVPELAQAYVAVYDLPAR